MHGLADGKRPVGELTEHGDVLAGAEQVDDLEVLDLPPRV
jgi:hypothetical protein